MAAWLTVSMSHSATSASGTSVNANVKPSEDVPHPNTWMVPQDRTEAILRAHLRTLGGHVEYAQELVGIEHHGDAVTAEFFLR